MATFHGFPDLPTELRLLIWNHHAQPDPGDPPRIVELGVKAGPCDPKSGRCSLAIHATFNQFYASSPTPSILQVCREARSVGETYYRKTFVCPHLPHSNHAGHFAWLNFDTDTIRMSLQHVEKTGGEDRHLIQHLQLTSNDDEALSSSVLGPEELDFCSLKSVDILHDGSMTAWYTLLADEDNCSWACGPDIVRVIHEQSGEVLDYDKDREIVNREIIDWSTQWEESSEDEDSF